MLGESLNELNEGSDTVCVHLR